MLIYGCITLSGSMQSTAARSTRVAALSERFALRIMLAQVGGLRVRRFQWSRDDWLNVAARVEVHQFAEVTLVIRFVGTLVIVVVRVMVRMVRQLAGIRRRHDDRQKALVGLMGGHLVRLGREGGRLLVLYGCGGRHHLMGGCHCWLLLELLLGGQDILVGCERLLVGGQHIIDETVVCGAAIEVTLWIGGGDCV